MADYAIRVELRGDPDYETYETLHAVMKSLGFLQTVDGIDSDRNAKRFNLPHAMYYGSSNSDCSAVADKVRDAVKTKGAKGHCGVRRSG